MMKIQCVVGCVTSLTLNRGWISIDWQLHFHKKQQDCDAQSESWSRHGASASGQSGLFQVELNLGSDSLSESFQKLLLDQLKDYFNIIHHHKMTVTQNLDFRRY